MTKARPGWQGGTTSPTPTKPPHARDARDPSDDEADQLLADVMALRAEGFTAGQVMHSLDALRVARERRLAAGVPDAPPQRRPPRAERPLCPATRHDGSPCGARRWWPKHAPGPEAWCQAHLLQRSEGGG